jgi:DNA phosphorothioation-dependent restriction protein DptG
MTSASLSFVDESQFLTVIQLVLPLHECANPAPTESVAEPLHFVADSAAAEEATVEYAIEPLHYATDPVGSGVTLT